jgi:hypothetical protein
MNEQNPTPPVIPNAGHAGQQQSPPPPRMPGDDSAERVPIRHGIAAIEAVLRQPLRLLYQLRQPGAGWLIAQMVFIAIACVSVYGVVVGTFSGSTQLWAAPVKIAAGMMISASICLPSLYIFTCLSGSKAHLAEVCGLLAGLLMLMTILLVGFAPVAWIFSQSTESLAWMGFLHILFWFVAAFFGVRFLRHGFSHTEARSSAGVNVWIIIFLLVALQMTTALRPIIGKADTFFPAKKEFFIQHWFDCLNDGSNPIPNPSN